MEQKNNSVTSAGTKDDSSTIADVITSSPNDAKPYVGCQGLSVDLNDMLYSTLFVYSKDGKIKVLDYQSAKQLKNQMSKDGWLHTATLNSCVFIEYLANNEEYVDVINTLKKLSVVG